MENKGQRRIRDKLNCYHNIAMAGQLFTGKTPSQATATEAMGHNDQRELAFRDGRTDIAIALA